MDVPTIATERLILRGFSADDFAASAAMWADPEVVRHVGGKVNSPQESWARVLRNAGHWQLCGFGFWAVVEAATGLHVGELGFADFKRTLEPAMGDFREAGWAFARRAHGRGFATEGMRAAFAWDGERFARQTTRCIIDPGNSASERVAEKLGFRHLHDATYHGERVTVYERLPGAIDPAAPPSGGAIDQRTQAIDNVRQ